MIVRELLASFGLDVKSEDFKKADQAVNGLRSSAAMLAGVFAAGGLALGMSKLVRSASDSVVVLNIIRRSFGEYADEVVSWANESAKAMGRSSNDMAQYAAQLGAVLTPLTKNEEASSKMSRSLTELAVDLGSFFNAAEPEVLQALQSALVGQARPMMKYGVVLNEATLAQYALSQGITKNIRDMSQAEVIALRYGFIMASTANAQGDATRTSAGYANSTKALRGALKDLGELIGQKLLPGATKMTRIAIEAIQRFRQWTDGTKIFEVVIKGTTLAMAAMAFVAGVVLVSKLGTLTVVLGKAALAYKGLGAAAVLAQIKMFAIGIAVLAVLALVLLVAEDIYQFFTGGESLLGKLLDKWDGLINRIRTGDIDPNSHWLTLLLYWFALKVADFGDVWMKAQDWWLDSNVSLIKELKMLWQDWAIVLRKDIEGVSGPIDALAYAWNVPIRIWRATVLRFIQWVAGAVKNIPVLGPLAQFAARGMDVISGAPLIGIGDPGAVASPTMSAGGGPGGGITNVNAPVRAEINISQLPGESGQELAVRVEEQFHRLLETELQQTLVGVR